MLLSLFAPFLVPILSRVLFSFSVCLPAMSESGASFSELKDGESSAPSTSIPINTSLTGADKPLPTTVDKPSSVKNATFSSDYSSLFVPAPHPAYTVDWFTHYLKQTRVLIILALLIYMLVLVIWIASLGKATNVAAAAGVVCPQWSGAELVPAVVSTCPPARAEIYYAGSPSSGGVRINANSVNQEDVATQPLAIFIPSAAASYYYTAVFLDPDYPTRQSPTQRSNLRGVLTNLRLGESVDTASGQWAQRYEGPTSTDTAAHRYVWLIYRHSTATSNLQIPAQTAGFNVEEWLTNSWSQRPTLVAAAYFEAAGAR